MCRWCRHLHPSRDQHERGSSDVTAGSDQRMSMDRVMQPVPGMVHPIQDRVFRHSQYSMDDVRHDGVRGRYAGGNHLQIHNRSRQGLMDIDI